MKSKLKLAVYSTMLAMIAASSVSTASACGKDPKDGFLPKNDMKIPVRRQILDNRGRPLAGGITEKEFNGVISAVEEVYAPIIQSMGGNLVIERNWSDPTVNAYATRQGKDWIVAMFGGLARHKETTPDGFMLVVCHELGHHIGGAPKYNRGSSDEWASNEGEADYFATLKCARRVLAAQKKLRPLVSDEIPEVVKQACGHEYRFGKDAATCVRTSMGGLSLGRLLADLGGEDMPKFETPDPSKVTRTYDAHPAAQCRLDTYFNGSLCNVDYTIDVDQKDPTVGACNQENGDKEGFRPRCWYAPKAKNTTFEKRGLRPRNVLYF